MKHCSTHFGADTCGGIGLIFVDHFGGFRSRIRVHSLDRFDVISGQKQLDLAPHLWVAIYGLDIAHGGGSGEEIVVYSNKLFTYDLKGRMCFSSIFRYEPVSKKIISEHNLSIRGVLKRHDGVVHFFLVYSIKTLGNGGFRFEFHVCIITKLLKNGLKC